MVLIFWYKDKKYAKYILIIKMIKIIVKTKIIIVKVYFKQDINYLRENNLEYYY